MARKRHSHKKKNPILEYRQLPLDKLYRRLDEYRESGNFRAALDVAKECQRRQQTPAHAELLASVYVDRGRQLIEKNLHTEALMVLTNALSLGHGNVDLLRLVFECGVRSGQYDSAVSSYKRLQDPTARQEAMALLADEAIVRGDGVGPLSQLCEPALREEINHIRQAFAAFEQGDDETVAAELKPIGLHSPCAQWKWLLRGLTAYHQDDADQARACWARAAGRGRVGQLADHLRGALDSESGSVGPTGAAQIAGRISSCFANPRVELLRDIEQAIEEEDPDEALSLCGKLLATIDLNERQSYALRLARAICPAIGHEIATLKRFLKLFGELPEDPGLFRATAVNCEQEFPLDSIEIWRLYLDFLKEFKALPPHLYKRARGMVWHRIGDLERTFEDDEWGPSWDGRSDDPGERAVRAYETSIELYGDDVQVHEKLLETLKAGEEWKRAEKQAERILKKWPTHTASLLFLGSQCLERDALRKAAGYFEQARKAQPFDNEIRRQIATCFLLSARRRLDSGKIDLARTDYEQAAQYAEGDLATTLYGKWAALEFRAGDVERAEPLVERARKSSQSTLLVDFVLAVEVQRAAATADVCQRFEQRFMEALRQPPTALDAAEVAHQMNCLRNLAVEYPNRSACARAFLSYLRGARLAAMDFAEDQLLEVCTCVEPERDWALLQKLAAHGAEHFAHNHLFVVHLAKAEIHQGREISKPTRRLLDQAGKRASAEGKLDVASLLAMLTQGLMPPEGNDAMGFMAGLLAGEFPLDVIAGLQGLDLEDPDEEDWDYDAGYTPPPRPPRKRPQRRETPNQLSLFENLPDAESEVS